MGSRVKPLPVVGNFLQRTTLYLLLVSSYESKKELFRGPLKRFQKGRVLHRVSYEETITRNKY